MIEEKIYSPPKVWHIPQKQFIAALKDPWYCLIFNIIQTIIFTTYDFFREKNFSPSLMPITCSSVTSPMGLGSDSLPVSVYLFDKKTYLADSMQFHLEYLLRQNNKGVFYIMPTFRGEDPDERHLNQFFHIEAELLGGLNEVISCVNGLLKKYTENILKHHKTELIRYTKELSHLENFVYQKEVNRITFKEALKLVPQNQEYYNQYNETPIAFTNQGEQYLMRKMGGPVWLTHLPSTGVPFYQKNDPQDENYALCADLLMGIGETVGCGERHDNYENVVKALQFREIAAEPYDWYLSLKKHFPMQTGGFGIGLERFLLWVLRHDDIRDIPLILRLKHLDAIP